MVETLQFASAPHGHRTPRAVWWCDAAISRYSQKTCLFVRFFTCSQNSSSLRNKRPDLSGRPPCKGVAIGVARRGGRLGGERTLRVPSSCSFPVSHSGGPHVVSFVAGRRSCARGARAMRGVSSSRLALSATLSSLPRPRFAPPRTFLQEGLRHATAPTSLRGRNRACNFNCNRRHQMLIEVSIRFQDSSSMPLSRVFEPWILLGLPCRATAPLLLPSSACLSGCLIVAGELVFSSPLWLCNDLCAAGSA